MRLTLIQALWVRVRVLGYRLRRALYHWKIGRGIRAKWARAKEEIEASQHTDRPMTVTDWMEDNGYSLGGEVPSGESVQDSVSRQAAQPSPWGELIGAAAQPEDELTSRAVGRFTDPLMEGAHPPPLADAANNPAVWEQLFRAGAISRETYMERMLSAGQPVYNPWRRETYNITRQVEIVRTAPELAAHLQREARDDTPAQPPPKPRVVFVTRNRRKLRLTK